MKSVYVTALMLSVITLCGCRSVKTIEKPVYIHDTTATIREVHDSSFFDRWHTEYVNGDTVFRIDSVYCLRYVYKRDTVWSYSEVPVVTKEQVRVEVEKELTPWQQFRMKSFWWLSVGLIGYILWRTRKLWGKFIKFVKV